MHARPGKGLCVQSFHYNMKLAALGRGGLVTAMEEVAADMEARKVQALLCVLHRSTCQTCQSQPGRSSLLTRRRPASCGCSQGRSVCRHETLDA